MHCLEEFLWSASGEWLYCYSEIKLLIYSRPMKLKKNNQNKKRTMKQQQILPATKTG